MSELIDRRRRRFLGTAATSLAAASLGVIRLARAQSGAPRQKPASHTSLGPIKQIDAGLLNVGYAESAPPAVPWSFCCTGGLTTSTATSTSLPCWHPRATG